MITGEVIGWAYNVWNVTNSEDAVYTFQLEGEGEIILFLMKKKNPTTLYFPEGNPAGSEGGKAQFEGRVVVIQVDSLS